MVVVAAVLVEQDDQQRLLPHVLVGTQCAVDVGDQLLGRPHIARGVHAVRRRLDEGRRDERVGREPVARHVVDEVGLESDVVGLVLVEVGIEFEDIVLVVAVAAPGQALLGVDPVVDRLAGELGLDVGQPDVIGPSVAADRSPV